MIYNTSKGQTLGPGACSRCGQHFIQSPKYHTMKVIKNSVKVEEAFCDAYCSTVWYELKKNKKSQ